MCTLLILRRPEHVWPVLIATNRDENHGRPWLPPARHWPDLPDTIAGQDTLAGGAWLGMNDHGVVAGVMNRTGTLGPEPGKRSRGELVLNALTEHDAIAASHIIADLEPMAYRPFNLVIADSAQAYWVSWKREISKNRIELDPIPPGLSMFTDQDRNDPSSPRIHVYLPEFARVAIPDPDSVGGWAEWTQLLGDRRYAPEAGPKGAMTIDEGQFGTLSSSLIALPAKQDSTRKPKWWFAAGPPDLTPYRPVAL